MMGGSDPTVSLTSAEQANQGTHQYTMTCESEGSSSSTSSTATIGFTSEGVYLGSDGFYAKIGTNVYQNSYGTIVTLLPVGIPSNHFTVRRIAMGRPIRSK